MPARDDIFTGRIHDQMLEDLHASKERLVRETSLDYVISLEIQMLPNMEWRPGEPLKLGYSDIQVLNNRFEWELANAERKNLGRQPDPVQSFRDYLAARGNGNTDIRFER